MKIKTTEVKVKDIKFPNIEINAQVNTNCLCVVLTGKRQLATVNCTGVRCGTCVFNKENYEFLMSLNEEGT